MSNMFNFGLSSEQQDIKTSLRRYLDSECGMPEIRKIIESPTCLAAKIWHDFAGLGFLGLAIPAEYGGSGLGYVELAMMLESLGQVALPAPYLETVAVADLIAKAGSDEQKAEYLPKIASGDLLGTFGIDEPGGFWDEAAVAATATPVPGGYVLHGEKLWVPYATQAGLIICAVRTLAQDVDGAGISLVALDTGKLDVRTRELDGMDDSYRLGAVTLDGLEITTSDLLGPPGAGWCIWLQTRQLINVLASAELVGCMEKSLEMIIDYAKQRTQFGKPIGSYQAIKHRCADMLIDMEGVRGSFYYAAWALQQQAADADIAVSSTKAYAADAAVRCTENTLQSFGAVGFTWEYDIHFFLKRTKRLQVSHGDANFHREQIAALWL